MDSTFFKKGHEQTKKKMRHAGLGAELQGNDLGVSISPAISRHFFPQLFLYILQSLQGVYRGLTATIKNDAENMELRMGNTEDQVDKVL